MILARVIRAYSRTLAHHFSARKEILRSKRKLKSGTKRKLKIYFQIYFSEKKFSKRNLFSEKKNKSIFDLLCILVLNPHFIQPISRFSTGFIAHFSGNENWIWKVRAYYTRAFSRVFCEDLWRKPIETHLPHEMCVAWWASTNLVRKELNLKKCSQNTPRKVRV